MPLLELDNVSASYGDQKVLDGITLSVSKGDCLGLIGPSGSGKSTILRVLTGLLAPDAGTVRIDGQVVDFSSKDQIRALRNRIAIVFQQYNLFQNMSALENVMLAPCKVQRRKRSQVREEAVHLLERVGLADRMDHFPDQLSGGQQQRVAIARSLCLNPEIMLLDEVTAALDPELVSEVLDVIQGLAQDGMTMLIVSHEMGFIRKVSGQVAFMAEGKLVELGQPAGIFDSPFEPRTRDFVGKILRH